MLKIVCLLLLVVITESKEKDETQCADLNKLQYRCQNFKIDTRTQQPVTCAPDNSIIVNCTAAPGIICAGGVNNRTFNLTIADGCRYGSHVSYSTAVILSVFLGFFGIDRIYLGYYAIGLFKMFSLGGLFVFWLVDVVLITLQLLGPADGTAYFMPYYGPKVYPISHAYNSSCPNCI